MSLPADIRSLQPVLCRSVLFVFHSSNYRGHRCWVCTALLHIPSAALLHPLLAIETLPGQPLFLFCSVSGWEVGGTCQAGSQAGDSNGGKDGKTLVCCTGVLSMLHSQAIVDSIARNLAGWGQTLVCGKQFPIHARVWEPQPCSDVRKL